MRKITAIGTIAVLLFVLAGCGGSGGSGGGGSAVSEDAAKQAFMISFVSVLTASFGLAFDQEIPGATLDKETGELTLEDFSLEELAGEDSDMPYTTVSGNVISEEDAMVVDLTLEGGPVKSIGYTLGGDEIQSDEGFSITITVNGKEIELEIMPEDMQGS